MGEGKGGGTGVGVKRKKKKLKKMTGASESCHGIRVYRMPGVQLS